MNLFDYNKTMTQVNIEVPASKALIAIVANRLPSLVFLSCAGAALIIYAVK
jgi:hypothetical protein